MDFAKMTLSEFTMRLGSGDPTPGGGGASALAGCLGAALANMVANLTVGRKKYESSWEDMEDVIRQTQILRERFLSLIEKDARMFEPLSKAYSMPRGTKEEKEKRETVMGQALKDACLVPLEIMENVCYAIDLIQVVAEKGSLSAVSDAGDAAAFCKASLQGAALNVFINTKYMKDRVTAEEYNTCAQEMLDVYEPRAAGIYEKVLEQLRT